MRKKITWEYLVKYAFDFSKETESIIYYRKDKYFLGFNKKHHVKLFPSDDWSDVIVVSKNMSYKDMFKIIKQLKEKKEM